MGAKSGLLEEAVRGLHEAVGLEQVQQIVRTAARRLVNAHGATVVLLDGEQCFYADEDAVSPLWKGQRFPVGQCISGWSMLNRRTAVVPDIRVDERIPQGAYLPTFVRSLVMVPVRIADPLGAIGAYWASTHRASDAEVRRLSTLAEALGGVLAGLLPSAEDLPDPVAARG